MKTLFILSLFLAVIAPLAAQPEPWVKQQIYKIQPVDLEDIDSDDKANIILTLNALCSPDKYFTALCDKPVVETIRWDRDTMKAERALLELPPGISAHDGGFQQSFGRTFFIPEFEKPIKKLRVFRDNYPTLRIGSCALDARNGQLPIFCDWRIEDPIFRRFSPCILALVSLDTGKIEPLATLTDDEFGNIMGPIAWLDDQTLAIVYGSLWAVFDIKKRAIIAQGRPKGGKNNFVKHFIIRDNRLFGIQADDTIVQLYPVPHRWNNNRMTTIDEELLDKIDIPFQSAIPSYSHEKKAKEDSQNQP